MNIFSALFNRLTDRRREKRNQQFREFMETYHASHAWTLLTCKMCGKPAPAPDAKFCVSCGASLYASSSLLHPAFQQERITGPVKLPERPMLAYLEMKDQMEHRNTGPHTQLHRAIHLQKVYP